MKGKQTQHFIGVIALLLIFQLTMVNAQSWLPPMADNQYASVTQGIGLVEVNVTYYSPDVTAPNGENRTGKIWGQLVPYGFADMNGNPLPWRAGANQNTTFSVSHDVMIEGQKLSAGKYGLHMAPGENEWIIIFSKANNAWGSFSYDESQDALRVTVKPEASEYHEWLTYEFVERGPKSSTVAMKWENLSVPVRITVPNLASLYVANMKEQFGSFSLARNVSNFLTAAGYCINNDIELEQALQWANAAASPPFVGQFSFRTYAVKSIVLEKLGRDEEAANDWQQAMSYIPNDAKAVMFEGWYLMNVDPETALKVFQYNQKQFPKEVFTVNEGLARGYTATGDKKKAIKHWEIAIKNVSEEDKQWLPFYEQALNALKNS